MSAQNRHFIVGYGSLINSSSRAKTGETGHVWSIKIAGFERHWSIMSSEFGMSSVAVIPKLGAYCNGVLIEISEEEIPAFDKREQGYKRTQIDPQQLSAYDDEVLPTGTVWIYHSHEITSPNVTCPITLSYADVILAGCLEHGATFVEDFLQHTRGWENTVLNDRRAPRYPRVQPELDVTKLNALFENVANITQEELSITYEF
ncbi:gamma-glutamylcyclotransferase [Marinomonas sp. 15G1-11]|uniref:Gamma-glutamylcyclotransferase n=1 Tax=Marinomonas phaeophyticola TaxID=3004091 RepID=A0ABT4JUH2_9GAMM|nr:gamma-glutamylcyclotransferase family protein [Marinomonas sp. 15G1-11]MCZ2721875.1 gamma-glutamylcyclotransferase [Marinomonas sp. 15G1-11]